MKRFVPLSILLLAFTPLTFAQDLTTDEIVTRLTERAETIQDVAFLITGNLIDADGQEIPLEVNVATLPADNLFRADFLQPDALADNSIIIDGQDVYNYVYLTNQVSIFSLDDPQAFGGLFPSDEVESGGGRAFTFTLDLVSLFDGWTTSSQGLSESEAGPIYTLRFDNNEEGLAIGHVTATVAEETWLPTTMNFYAPDDTLIVELVLNDFALNEGLNPDDVRYLDPSAEVIDER
jgi:outer membrane lipoprotein-sorting protein